MGAHRHLPVLLFPGPLAFRGPTSVDVWTDATKRMFMIEAAIKRRQHFLAIYIDTEYLQREYIKGETLSSVIDILWLSVSKDELRELEAPLPGTWGMLGCTWWIGFLPEWGSRLEEKYCWQKIWVHPFPHCSKIMLDMNTKFNYYKTKRTSLLALRAKPFRLPSPPPNLPSSMFNYFLFTHSLNSVAYLNNDNERYN